MACCPACGVGLGCLVGLGHGVVVRLEFEANALLFTGDTVSRHIGDPPDAFKDAEEVMVDNAETFPLKSAVIIAPHHGADTSRTRGPCRRSGARRSYDPR